MALIKKIAVVVYIVFSVFMIDASDLKARQKNDTNTVTVHKLLYAMQPEIAHYYEQLRRTQESIDSFPDHSFNDPNSAARQPASISAKKVDTISLSGIIEHHLAHWNSANYSNNLVLNDVKTALRCTKIRNNVSEKELAFWIRGTVNLKDENNHKLLKKWDKLFNSFLKLPSQSARSTVRDNEDSPQISSGEGSLLTPSSLSSLAELWGAAPRALHEAQWAELLKHMNFGLLNKREQLVVLTAIRNKTLGQLTIRNCGALSDAWLKAIDVSKMTKVSFSGLSLCVEGILTLLNRADQLIDVRLSNMTTLMYLDNLSAVSTKKDRTITMPNLRELSIDHCHSLLEINLFMPNLDRLALENCPSLKNNSFIALIKLSRKLTSLFLLNTTSMFTHLDFRIKIFDIYDYVSLRRDSKHLDPILSAYTKQLASLNLQSANLISLVKDLRTLATIVSYLFDMPLLHLAAASQRIALFNFLSMLGFNISERNNQSNTILHAMASHIEIELKNFSDKTSLDPRVAHKKTLDQQDDRKTLFQSVAKNSKAINAQNIKGLTPLHFAALSNNDLMTQLLLEEGADPCISDDEKNIPLHFCLRAPSNSLKIKKLNTLYYFFGFHSYEKSRDRVRENNRYGRPRVNEFTADYFEGVINETKDNGALILRQLNSQNKYGQTPLHSLCAGFRPNSLSHSKIGILFIEILKALAKKNNDFDLREYLNRKDAQGKSAWFLASQNMPWEIINHLLDTKMVDLEAKDLIGNTLLHNACKQKLDPFIQYLLAHSTNNIDTVNDAGTSPLIMAFSVNEEISFDEKSQDSADHVILYSKYPLPQATSERPEPQLSDDIKSLLLAKSSSKGSRAVLMACQQKNGDLLNNLLLQELDGTTFRDQVNTRLPLTEGDTYITAPLLISAGLGDFDCVAILFAYKVDHSVRDSNNNTVLHKAVESGNCNLVDFVFILGAHTYIDQQNNVFETPLHIACRNGFIKIVALLLTEKANVTLTDTDGKTALARAEGNEGIIKLFQNLT